MAKRTQIQKAIALAALMDEFDTINEAYFDGKLPKIRIQLMREKAYRQKGTFYPAGRSRAARIRINCRFDWSSMCNTLRHEIAHYVEWLRFGVTTDASPKFAAYCAFLGVEHTIYRGRHAHQRRQG